MKKSLIHKIKTKHHKKKIRFLKALYDFFGYPELKK